MKKNNKSLGVIGVGSFAEFFLPHLRPFFSEIRITSRSDKSEVAERLGVRNSTLEEVCAQDVIMLAMPISQIVPVLESIKDRLKAGAIVLDVCSVKVWPLEEMKRLLPEEVQILGTHPLFGPQSGKHGVKGLQIVLCPERIAEENFRELEEVFIGMGLQVKETTAQRHDEIMAYTQAITHFFSRAAARTIPFADFEFTTPSAQRLQSIINEVKDDAQELFLDMQTKNPYAIKTRKKLLQELNQLNEELCQKK